MPTASRGISAPADTPAPVIEVSGRMYPVDVRYRPLVRTGDDEADDEEELEDAIVDAVEDLWRSGPGDILVFLPGEREIRETSALLRKGLARRPYARRSRSCRSTRACRCRSSSACSRRRRGRRHRARDQRRRDVAHRARHPLRDRRRARARQALFGAQQDDAAADREDLAGGGQPARRPLRPRRPTASACASTARTTSRRGRSYTDPEILRSSLAAVILRMGALVARRRRRRFRSSSRRGRARSPTATSCCRSWARSTPTRRLTPLGRELARLPVDPRVGRMVLAAREHGCVAEMLVIASALSVPDPRERPLAKQQAADQAHLMFRDERSDFLSLLALWQFFDAKLAREALAPASWSTRAARSSSRTCACANGATCTRSSRARSRTRAGSGRPRCPRPSTPRSTRRSTRRCSRASSATSARMDGETDGYAGARGIRFFLHPGSGLAKKRPKWVLAAELVETSRLFARCAAKIEPEWIEAVAGDRVTRDYFEPRWDEERGEVVASERVQLYGLDARRAAARVVRRASIPGRARGLHPRGARPGRARDEGRVPRAQPEARRRGGGARAQGAAAGRAGRRRDDRRVLRRAHSRRRAFARDVRALARRRPSATIPRALLMTREALMRHAAAHVTEELFPETLEMAGAVLPLKYRFAPGQPGDGLTLTVPLALLNQIDAARLSWLVPGTDPRKGDVAAEGAAQGAAQPARAAARRGDRVPRSRAARPRTRWTDALRGWLRDPARRARCRRTSGTTSRCRRISRCEVRVIDAAGRELASGRDLARAARASWARRRSFRSPQAGPVARAARTQGVDLRRPARDARDREARPAAHRLSGAGRRRRQRVDRAARHARRGRRGRRAPAWSACCASRSSEASPGYEKGGAGFAQAALQLKTTIPTDAAAGRRAGRGLRSRVRRRRSAAAIRKGVCRADEACANAAAGGGRRRVPAARRHRGARITRSAQRIARGAAVAVARASPRCERRRDALVYPGFFAATPWAQLAHLPRYLTALEHRLAKYAENPERDARHAAQVETWWERYRERRDANRAAAGRRARRSRNSAGRSRSCRFRSSRRSCKTPYPVSGKRLEKAWAELCR